MCADPMLPGTVEGALREYRDLLGEHGITWGEPEIAYVKLFARRRMLPAELKDRFWRKVLERLIAMHPGEPLDRLSPHLSAPDYDEALRDTLRGDLPAHAAALRLTPEGPVLEGGPWVVLEGGHGLEPIPFLVDNRWEAPATITVDGTVHEISGRGAWLTEITLAGEITLDGRPLDLAPLRTTAPRSSLTLRAGSPCRWSVTLPSGQGWFPRGLPYRHDFHGRPYFHGDDLTLDVPALPLTVTAARGMEYGEARAELTPSPGVDHTVRLTPHRLYDAAARGWFGGDLHVHLNWAGDHVAAPREAAAAQHGEDLHVLNLLAGNVSGPRVYDREALTAWAGRDLPWSDATHVARMGAEYRNDLLGHAYAFGFTGVPALFHTGFDGDDDWPPNATGLAALREMGALLGYSHPFGAELRDDDGPGVLFGPLARVCAARRSSPTPRSAWSTASTCSPTPTSPPPPSSTGGCSARATGWPSPPAPTR
ncbi:hypothetical protein OIE66_23345 [Nonomuraea sp. NBC_01738]|uniref:hypothetical protein n=1 Tax=Nonomuraea sp. NBC_01738 TaxID=2976003 RepID=UPI002E0D6450|nr:hypothetical protein OIE66_23345 [Nonomuraea sp. NBC_01738]